MVAVQNTTMLRYNEGKPPVTLIPSSFMRALIGVRSTKLTFEVARVLDFGSKKYSAHNWRKGGTWSSVLSCALRHLVKFQGGEMHDGESELHHLGHLGCNLAFLIEFVQQTAGEDDRYEVADPIGPSQSYGVAGVLDNLLAFQDGGGVAYLERAIVILAAYCEENLA